MKKGCVIGVAILVVLLLAVLALGISAIGVWNNLNMKHQVVNSGKSQYSAALNVCTEKIKGVWEIANQYMDHESKTFIDTAAARSGYTKAVEEFESALKEGKDTKELTKAGDEAVRTALAFRIQVEAYPQLRAVETSQENMRNLEVATNEIKTSLDDWIVAIRDYNTYRGYAFPSMIGSFFGKFPAQIEYYEGEVKKLDIDSLNPAKRGQPATKSNKSSEG